MSAQPEIADVLERAAGRIESLPEWPNSDTCAALAIDDAASSDREGRRVRERFAKHLHVKSVYDIWHWNDAPERTQAEVVAKLREAAALARATPSPPGRES